MLHLYNVAMNSTSHSIGKNSRFFQKKNLAGNQQEDTDTEGEDGRGASTILEAIQKQTQHQGIPSPLYLDMFEEQGYSSHMTLTFLYFSQLFISAS